MLIEGVHFPDMRTMTMEALSHGYRAALKQFCYSRKLYKTFGVQEAGMNAYKELMDAIWEEIERRADNELHTELTELIYSQLIDSHD